MQHLPPGLGHPEAGAVVSEFIGTAMTRALLQIEAGGERPMHVLATRLPDVLRRELKQGLLRFMNAERAVLSRLPTDDSCMEVAEPIAKIRKVLANAAERLESVDSRQLADEWLDDFATGRRMFLELRSNEIVQRQIRRIIFGINVLSRANTRDELPN